MKTLHARAFPLFLLCCSMGSLTATAEPPLFNLMPFRKVEANATQDYTLTTKQGPWVIMAYSFAGESAEAQAKKLALDLRKNHQLQAYVHKQEYDYSKTVEGLGVDKFGNPKKMKFANAGAGEEFAVVVGNFRSFEDPDATRALNVVRSIQPQALGNKADPKDKTISVSMIRDYYRKITKNEELKKRGPMAKAFMSRNPLLPAEQVAKGSLDSFVKDLNDGVQYSLLANPRKYTLQIASFRGVTAFNENEYNESVKNNKSTAKIDEAAIKAAKLAAALRADGVEAYVFHDRYESIVTVSGTDDLGTKNDSGRTELPPEIAKLVKRFEAQRQPIPGSTQLGLIPKTVAGIPCDVSPRLIQVPRENIADVYNRRLTDN